MSDHLRASYRFCGELSRREAKNFYYSFLVLPPERRRSMCAQAGSTPRTRPTGDCCRQTRAMRMRTRG